ncbi:hypothetical protein QF047_004146 [Arthrobacter sp. W4I7]|nr:hypothetical protein [Arthrobacter sp. W4I7]
MFVIDGNELQNACQRDPLRRKSRRANNPFDRDFTLISGSEHKPVILLAQGRDATPIEGTGEILVEFLIDPPAATNRKTPRSEDRGWGSACKRAVWRSGRQFRCFGHNCRRLRMSADAGRSRMQCYLSRRLYWTCQQHRDFKIASTRKSGSIGRQLLRQMTDYSRLSISSLNASKLLREVGPGEPRDRFDSASREQAQAGRSAQPPCSGGYSPALLVPQGDPATGVVIMESLVNPSHPDHVQCPPSERRGCCGRPGCRGGPGRAPAAGRPVVHGAG